MTEMKNPIPYHEFLLALKNREIKGVPLHLDELSDIADLSLENGDHETAAAMFKELAKHVKTDCRNRIDELYRRAAALLNVDRKLLEENHYEWVSYTEINTMQNLSETMIRDFIVTYSPKGRNNDLWLYFREKLSDNNIDPISWLVDFSNGTYKLLPNQTPKTLSHQRDGYIVDQAATSVLKALHQFIEARSRHILYSLITASDQMKPIPLPWLKVNGGDHHLVLRESRSGGLFMTGNTPESKVKIREPYVDELLPLSKALPQRLQFLVGAPTRDSHDNRTNTVFCRSTGSYFIEASNSDAKPRFRAEFIEGAWEITSIDTPNAT